MSTIDTINTNASTCTRKSGGTTGTFLHWFSDAMTKRRTRIHLSELSNELLEDIGVAPAEARREMKRFFWD